jgi:hypothetical protein
MLPCILNGVPSGGTFWAMVEEATSKAAANKTVVFMRKEKQKRCFRSTVFVGLKLRSVSSWYNGILINSMSTADYMATAALPIAYNYLMDLK